MRARRPVSELLVHEELFSAAGKCDADDQGRCLLQSRRGVNPPRFCSLTRTPVLQDCFNTETAHYL